MRRLKVLYRPEAIADLGEIYRFVAMRGQNRVIARDFVERIKARCSRIGNAPLGGISRDDLESGLRTVPFEKSAVIAYKVEKDAVRIGNIFHGGRDFEALYHGRPLEDRDDEEASS
ncbi:type II toxin-antitoxin system RelE/ParE family toxin [Pararhizobium sp. A13]|uniref:type II toxin-antitoxin system RelE/ParE family toxin n=1 Tax=Pararhizobium sp. A13 TaxID=3133975 RepID=UPI00311AF5B6